MRQIIYLPDESGVTLGGSNQPDKLLAVRCGHGSYDHEENRMDVFVAWPTTLGYSLFTDFEPLVSYVFDNEPTQIETWGPNSGTIVDVVFSLRPHAFIAAMKEHQRLTIRVVDWQDVTQTASWNIRGFRDSVRALEEKCPWGG